MKTFKSRTCPQCGSELGRRRKRSFFQKFFLMKKRKYECLHCHSIYFA